jgi:hypothetical protein
MPLFDHLFIPGGFSSVFSDGKERRSVSKRHSGTTPCIRLFQKKCLSLKSYSSLTHTLKNTLFFRLRRPAAHRLFAR